MSYEAISEKVRTSTKERHCIWCPEKIVVGEKYVDRVYEFDGEFNHDQLHPECFKALGESAEACEGFEAHAYHRGKNEKESADIDDAIMWAEDNCPCVHCAELKETKGHPDCACEQGSEPGDYCKGCPSFPICGDRKE